MAHAAPPSSGRALRNRLVGAAAVVVAIALIAVAIVSLHRPGEKQAGITTQSPSAEFFSSATSPPAAPAPAPAPSPTTTATPSTSPPTTSTANTSTATAPAVVKVTLAVANDTGQAGLAETAASRFEAAGWTVIDTSNFTGGILSTCAYYDPANPAAEAAALALQTQFPAIKRVKPRFDGLPDAPIVVVLTTDYS